MTQRDRIRFTRLAGTFRAVSARQDALLFDLTESQARRELERHCARGWLRRMTTWEVVPSGPLALTGPLAVRNRAGPVPDLRAVARQLAARRLRPRRPVVAYRATERAVNLVGGVMPDTSRIGHATHDLAAVDMFLAATRARPELAARWFGEDEIRRVLSGGDSYPDALVVNDDGSLRAFEMGGAYALSRLVEFVGGCKRLGIFEWEIF